MNFRNAPQADGPPGQTGRGINRLAVEQLKRSQNLLDGTSIRVLGFSVMNLDLGPYDPYTDGMAEWEADYFTKRLQSIY